MSIKQLNKKGFCLQSYKVTCITQLIITSIFFEKNLRLELMHPNCLARVYPPSQSVMEKQPCYNSAIFSGS